MTTTVSATIFCRNFGRYQRQAQREPVEVQSHGQTTGFFISADDFERFARLEAAAGKALHPRELDERLTKAVEDARMGSEHDPLNRLLD